MLEANSQMPFTEVRVELLLIKVLVHTISAEHLIERNPKNMKI
jgi:hypothetical protein